MIQIRIARHLSGQFSIPALCQATGTTVAEVLADLNRQYPGVADYVVHENGELRQHVNIFVGERFVKDRQRLTDAVAQGDEISIMQALSGG